MTADPSTNGKKKFNFNFGLGKKDDGSQASAQITVQEHDGVLANAQPNDSLQDPMTQSPQSSQQDNGIQVTEDNLVTEPVIQTTSQASSDNPFAAIVQNSEVETENIQPQVAASQASAPTQAIETQPSASAEENPFGAVAASPEVETEAISEFSATEPQFQSEPSPAFTDTEMTAPAGDNPFAEVAADESVEVMEETIPNDNPFAESSSVPEPLTQPTSSSNPFAGDFNSPQTTQETSAESEPVAVTPTANPFANANINDSEQTEEEMNTPASANPFANASINDSEKTAEEMNAPIGDNPFAAAEVQTDELEIYGNASEDSFVDLGKASPSETRETQTAAANPFETLETENSSEETAAAEETPRVSPFAAAPETETPQADMTESLVEENVTPPAQDPFANTDFSQESEPVTEIENETPAAADPFAFSEPEEEASETTEPETIPTQSPFAAVSEEETTAEIQPETPASFDAFAPKETTAPAEKTEAKAPDSPFSSLDTSINPTTTALDLVAENEPEEEIADPFAAPSFTEETPQAQAEDKEETPVDDSASNMEAEAFVIAEAQVETQDTNTTDDSSTAFQTTNNDDPLQTLVSIQGEITSFVQSHQKRVTDLEQQIVDVKKASHDKIADLRSKIKEEEELLKQKQIEFRKLLQEMEKLTASFDPAAAPAPEKNNSSEEAPAPKKKKRSRSKNKAKKESDK